jgi:hypothetical protein
VSGRRPREREPQEVLERAPWLVGPAPRSRRVVSAGAQLEELVGLVERGLLSPDEFERQRQKVLEI